MLRKKNALDPDTQLDQRAFAMIVLSYGAICAGEHSFRSLLCRRSTICLGARSLKFVHFKRR